MTCTNMNNLKNYSFQSSYTFSIVYCFINQVFYIFNCVLLYQPSILSVTMEQYSMMDNLGFHLDDLFTYGIRNFLGRLLLLSLRSGYALYFFSPIILSFTNHCIILYNKLRISAAMLYTFSHTNYFIHHQS